MKNFRFLVEEDIERIEKSISHLFLNNNDILYDLEQFLSEKSKRIRSIIALLYLKLNGLEINDNVIKLLSAGELIHNASLLHDDVIDDAEIRRGSQTLSKKYDAKIAILSGDYLLSFAVNYLNEISNKDVLNIFINITKLMSEAEIKQYFSRGVSVTKDEYLQIIYGKTASLFEGILESSAIITNINHTKAAEFGKIFGILFQINNDESSDSKQNDIQNGVKTLIDILGIEKTNNLKDNYKRELRAILNEYPDNKYKQVIEELIELL